MKNISIVLFTLFALASCSKSEDDLSSSPSKQMVSFSVLADQHESEATSDTRADIVDATTVVWTNGDEIATYAKSYSQSGGEKFILWLKSLFNNDKSATFEGTGSAPAQIDTYYAAYPETTSVNDVQAVFEIPASQDGVATPRLVAKCEDVTKDNISFAFQPIDALLHVKLDQPVDQIIFEACDGASVAGSYTYKYADGATSVTGSDKQISVTTGVATEFEIVVPAIHYAKGYKLTLKKGNDVMAYSYGFNSGKSLERGKSYPVALTFKPISVSMGSVESSCMSSDGSARAVNQIDGKDVTGGTIVARGASFAGVSTSLVSEAGYICNGVKYKSAAVATRFDAVCQLENISANWKNQEVKAYIIVNGVEYLSSTSSTTTLSGIPYFHKFSNKNSSGWSLFANDWSTTGVLELTVNNTDASRGYAVSPKFNITSDAPVKYVTMAYLYSTLPGSGSCTIWVEPTVNTTTKSQSSTGHYKEKSTNRIASDYGGDVNEGLCVLSQAKPYMAISHNCSKGTLQTRYIIIHSMDLKYQ